MAQLCQRRARCAPLWIKLCRCLPQRGTAPRSVWRTRSWLAPSCAVAVENRLRDELPNLSHAHGALTGIGDGLRQGFLDTTHGFVDCLDRPADQPQLL